MSADVTHVIALSGGKDSTAMALRLAEVEPRPYVYLTTPTGNELPEMKAHWARLEELLGTPLTVVTNGTLEGWMEAQNCLPSHRMRWCTRLLKIVPALAFLRAHQPAIQYVGLRADEPEDVRTGLEADDVTCDFPFRRWGWGLREVLGYLRARGMTIPERTDCAWCPFQRLGEWARLREQAPALYEEGKAWEARIGHTFRSPGRDSRPAGLAALEPFVPEILSREAFQAERARAKRTQGRLFAEGAEAEEDVYDGARKCRVCRM